MVRCNFLILCICNTIVFAVTWSLTGCHLMVVSIFNIAIPLVYYLFMNWPAVIYPCWYLIPTSFPLASSDYQLQLLRACGSWRFTFIESATGSWKSSYRNPTFLGKLITFYFQKLLNSWIVNMMTLFFSSCRFLCCVCALVSRRCLISVSPLCRLLIVWILDFAYYYEKISFSLSIKTKI